MSDEQQQQQEETQEQEEKNPTLSPGTPLLYSGLEFPPLSQDEQNKYYNVMGVPPTATSPPVTPFPVPVGPTPTVPLPNVRVANEHRTRNQSEFMAYNSGFNDGYVRGYYSGMNTMASRTNMPPYTGGNPHRGRGRGGGRGRGRGRGKYKHHKKTYSTPRQTESGQSYVLKSNVHDGTTTTTQETTTTTTTEEQQES